jgi:hypothetical protein
MIDDHHGRTLEEQPCRSEGWTGFSARTACDDRAEHSADAVATALTVLVFNFGVRRLIGLRVLVLVFRPDTS